MGAGLSLGVVAGKIVHPSWPDAEVGLWGLTGAFWGGALGVVAGFGHLICVVVGWFRRAPALRPADVSDDAKRLAFLEAMEDCYQGELRDVLLRSERIPVAFEGHRIGTTADGFTGRVAVGSDLEAAYRQSCAAEGAGGRLLVVGEPGSGKTVTLFLLAQYLCEQAHVDPSAPVPVVLSLGSWEPGTALEAWAAETLCAAGGHLAGADELASKWSRSGRIALLFDGLDEMPDESATACRVALNQYVDRLSDRVPFVLAGRLADAEAIDDPRGDGLAANAVIRLRRLTYAEVADHVRDGAIGDDDRWMITEPLVSRLQQEPDGVASQLLQLPLWLSVLDDSPGAHLDLADAETHSAARNVVLDAFLDGALGSGTDHRRWASAVAAFLAAGSPDRTTFHPENLTAGKRTPLRLRLIVALAVGLAVGLVVALVLGLRFGVANGMSNGLWFMLVAAATVWWNSKKAEPRRSRITWPGRRGLVRETREGLEFGLLFGLGAGLLASAIFGLETSLGPDKSLEGVVTGQLYAAGIAMAAAVLMVAVNCGTAIMDALKEGSRAVSRNQPDAGLRNSKAFLVAVTIVFALVSVASSTVALISAFGLIGFGGWTGPGWVLAAGLVAIFVVGAAFGFLGGLLLTAEGWFDILQVRARRRARRQGLLPPDLVAFLEKCCASGLMRRAGGGYRFGHRMILEKLALEAPESGLAATSGRQALRLPAALVSS